MISVKEIGNIISKDGFDIEDFLKFARENREKYSLIGDDNDFSVDTWNSFELVGDYKLQVNKS